MSWTAEQMPDLTGKVFIVTGGNSGIGLAAANEFARKGAEVVLACRDEKKANAAASMIRANDPRGSAQAMKLDLADLASVRAFAEAFAQRYSKLDVLVNNAGVMALPYCKTADGFEMQFGTNHLGHFALTGALLKLLLATPNARVVTVSSGVHRAGKINFDDLNGERSYAKWAAYAQSKLANLLFTYELQRRLEKSGATTRAVGCHPGYAATNLQAVGPTMEGSSLMVRLMEIGNRLLAQPATMGALPTMYAATAEDVRGSDYIGPSSIGELWGAPAKVKSNRASMDPAAAARLWQVSEDLTGVRYPFA